MLKLWPILAQFTAPELWVQVEYLVRILVAACLGLLIGSERKIEINRRAFVPM